MYGHIGQFWPEIAIQQSFLVEELLLTIKRIFYFPASNAKTTYIFTPRNHVLYGEMIPPQFPISLSGGGFLLTLKRPIALYRDSRRNTIFLPGGRICYPIYDFLYVRQISYDSPGDRPTYKTPHPVSMRIQHPEKLLVQRQSMGGAIRKTFLLSPAGGAGIMIGGNQ